jgi:hypothetical protein
VGKLHKIKDDKIRNYRLFNQRIISDHKRLVAQFNELKRFNILLVHKEQKLRLQIRKGSLTIKEPWVGMEIARTEVQRVKIRKKGFISLHNGTINFNNEKIVKCGYEEEDTTQKVLL